LPVRIHSLCADWGSRHQDSICRKEEVDRDGALYFKNQKHLAAGGEKEQMEMDFNEILASLGAWVVGTGLKIFLVLVVSLIVIKAVGIFSERLTAFLMKRQTDEEYKKRADTLASVIRHLLNVVILIVTVMTILAQLGVEIGPILAAAGIVGLAVGFGAQSLVKDVINGFFILLEDQVRVGDVVQINGRGGLVEKVNLKMIVLRDLSGNVHFIPNGKIDVVTNMTKGYSRYVFDIGIAYREDVDKVIEAIKEVDEDLRNDPEFAQDILEPIEILGLDRFADSAIIVRAHTTTKPIKQWRVGREFNKRLKKLFDQRDIEIPFPHVTVYMGQDKSGESAPLRIRTEEKSRMPFSE
jgi:moderate conductance mechanosensitive channel